MTSLDFTETILKTFPIDIHSTKRIHLKKTSKTTRIFTVDLEKSPLIAPYDCKVYLFDTLSCRKIACHPHIVADALSELCLDAAKEFAKALRELDLVSDSSAILHILRGGLGYKVDKALPETPVINIRTQYSEDGYRAHSDDSRKIEVTYSDYHRTSFDSLIIPDTYATGRSVETALEYMFEEGLNVESVILYGFIAEPGIERVYKLLKEHDISLIVFAICDVSQLYTNNYDMPLYGLDEHLYQQEGKIKPLGSIVSIETLRDMIPNYVPGMDQPGDWSERHQDLFNGYANESGDILGHLQKSIELMESLDLINKQQEWYNEAINKITKAEIESCKRLL